MSLERRVAPSDRRASPRVPLVCAVRHTRDGRTQLCLSANISRQGMEVWRVRDEPLGPGSSVRLEFELPGAGELISAAGTVVFDRDDQRTGVVGVRFADLDPEHEQVIAAYVRSAAPGPSAPRRAR